MPLRKSTRLSPEAQYLDPDCPRVQVASRVLTVRLDKADVRIGLAYFSTRHVPTCQRCQAYGEHIERDVIPPA